MNPSQSPETDTRRTPSFKELLFKGIAVVLPAVLLLLIGQAVLNFSLRILRPISAWLDPGFTERQWVVDLISLGMLVGILLIIGFLMRNRLAISELERFERNFLRRIPLYAMLRETVNQFTGLKKMPFSEAVLVDPFNSGTYMTGFIAEQSADGYYTVFVPTAPNPTNGFVFHLPESRINFTKVRPKDAMRTVVGMGTGSEVMFASTDAPAGGKEDSGGDTV